MKKTKVKVDTHGIYVRTGGYLFRPQVNKWKSEKDDTYSLFEIGDEVKAKHIDGTVMGKVNDEVWYSHGQYFQTVDGKNTYKNSEDCWDQ